MERKQIINALLILGLLLLPTLKIWSQELIFEKRPDQFGQKEHYGPNRRHFAHPFLSVSWPLPSDPENSTNGILPYSFSTTLGYRYKLKLTPSIAFLAEMGFTKSNYRLRREEMQNSENFNKIQFQEVRSSRLLSGGFIRFRLGQPGDYLGNYVDLGLATSLSLNTRLVTSELIQRQELPPYTTKRVTQSDLKDINTFNYTVLLRAGFDRIILFAQYRLNNLHLEEGVPDFPKINVGVELSLVTY